MHEISTAHSAERDTDMTLYEYIVGMRALNAERKTLTRTSYGTVDIDAESRFCVKVMTLQNAMLKSLKKTTPKLTGICYNA